LPPSWFVHKFTIFSRHRGMAYKLGNEKGGHCVILQLSQFSPSRIKMLISCKNHPFPLSCICLSPALLLILSTLLSAASISPSPYMALLYLFPAGFFLPASSPSPAGFSLCFT
jgi:hypothetical protein